MFYNVFFCFASDPTVLLKKPLCCYFRPADGLNCLRIEIAPPIDLVLPKLPITCIDLDPGSTCLRYKIPPLPPARPAPVGKKILKRAAQEIASASKWKYLKSGRKENFSPFIIANWENSSLEGINTINEIATLRKMQ